MRLTHHIAVSLVISGLVYLALRSAASALACFTAGVFIDLDHIVDYYVNYGPSFRTTHFFRVFRDDVFKHVVVFLHSWEWMLVCLAILWFLDWKPAAVGFFIGAFAHLALDNLFNNHSPPAYFITYRLLHGFSAKHFYGAREYRKRVRDKRTNETGLEYGDK